MTAATLTPRQIRELEEAALEGGMVPLAGGRWRLYFPAPAGPPAEIVWSRCDCPVLARLFGWGARVFILRDRLAVVR